MTNYKETLNLPHTQFPMKANLSQREPDILKKWQGMNLYQKIIEKNAGQPKFVLHDGPPYANGNLHLGHAINKSLKDFVVKSKQLSGFDASYIPGWDCHGLPIEHNVEKKKGKAGQKISHREFRDECRKYAKKQVEIQKAGFVRLGVLGDWDNPYLTMNYGTEADIVRALGKIVSNGHMVKGYKPVYWSVVGGSALAEAEVEYQEKESFAIDVKFRVADPDKFLELFSGLDGGKVSDSLFVVIWPTTPWTLPSNQAVCLNSTLDYALVTINKDDNFETILLATEMIDGVMKRYGIEEYEVLAEVKGAALENLEIEHPFINKRVPLILGEHVTTEAGTGAVHTAPDHGLDDFYAGQKYGINTLDLVDENGSFSSSAGEFAGAHVYKVDEQIIERLKANKKLLAAEKITHSYAHCWRTKTPLIYRATPQWFISMTEKDLLGSALNAIDGIKWIPDWGQARIELMLKGSPDWCISRQRTWGVPITIFVHKKNQELHPRTNEFFEEIACRIEQDGIDAWFDLDPKDLLGSEAEDYEKVTDTLDVWFDSGVTHYSVVEKRDELDFPADLYLEGSDQHRGWFLSSLKTAIAMYGSAPYKEVLTHGFFVDSEGRKMSKSLGNTVAPEKIFQQYGADILRLWVAATDYRGEMTVSEEIFKQVSDTYRRIRNTARFMLANLNGFDPLKHTVKPNDMLAMDCWIVRRCRSLQSELLSHYHDYNFLGVYQKIHNFCVVELGGFYLDVIKDRQYTSKIDSLARRSTQTAMFHILEMISRLIAPIISFTADEIWENIPGDREDSVFLTNFSDAVEEFPESSELDDQYWSVLMEVKSAVNKELENKRSEKAIGSGLGAEVELFCDAKLMTELRRLEEELRFVLIVSKASVYDIDQADSTAIPTGISGLKIRVEASKFKKCDRCWHHHVSVGKSSDHPLLCERCITNVYGKGESRRFA